MSCALLLVALQAHAAPVTVPEKPRAPDTAPAAPSVQVTPLDLVADLRLTLAGSAQPSPGTLVTLMSGDTSKCTAPLADRVVVLPQSCVQPLNAGAYDLVFLDGAGAKHTFPFSVTEAKDAPLVSGGSNLKAALGLATCPAEGVWFTNGAWRSVTLREPSCALDMPSAATPPIQGWLRTAAGPPVPFRLGPPKPTTAPSPPDTCHFRTFATPSGDPEPLFRTLTASEAPYRLVVDMTTTTPKITWSHPVAAEKSSAGGAAPELLPWLLPSRFVEVCVLSGGKAYTLQGSGTIGRADAYMEQGTPNTLSDPTKIAAAQNENALATTLLAPRQAGPMVVTIQTLELKGTEPKLTPVATAQAEAIVLPGYAAALRLGIGAPLMAAGHRYEVVEVSGQDVVTEGPRPDLQPELMVGIVPFFRPYGRVYPPGRTGWPPRFAPYLGTSVVTITQVTDPSAWLGAAWLGLDIEPVRSMSVAPLVGLRRTQELRDGLAVGDLDPGGTLTRTAFTGSLGVVVNVTPSYFQAVRKQLSASTMGDL